MSEQKPLFLRINEIKFDTISDVNNRTNCFATIIYHPDRKYIEDVTVTSSVFNTEKSELCWLYMGDNYQCDLQISDLSVLSEIADSIRDKEWEYEDTKTPLTDETIKHDVLEIMYNARELFADFIVERLSSGEYDDIAENGGVNLWEFKNRVERDYNVHIPQAYLCNLDNYDNRFGKSHDSRVTRKIKLYRKYTTEYFEIKDVVFDTAPCNVRILFQPQIGYVQHIWVTSNLSKIGQSKKEWIDITSNGLCDLITDNLDILAEIADCIKDKEWLYDKISPYPKKPLTDESKKQEILNVLYNASAMFADFVYENLKDTTGLMDIWDFKREIKRTYDVDLALCYLFNLFENDSRFVVKNKKFDHADIGINNNSELPDITDENNTEEQPSLSEEVTESEHEQSETLSENDISNDLSEQEAEDYDDEDDYGDEDDYDDDYDDEAEYDDDDDDDEDDEDDNDEDDEDDNDDDDEGTSIVEEYDDDEYEDCDENDYDDDEENVDDEDDEEEKPIFGYKEFMDWVTNDKDLKARFDAYFADWKNKPTDIDDILSFFRISPDSYSCGQYVDGCYQDDKGNWYHFSNDERTSTTPNGTRYSEEKCFKCLKTTLLVNLQHSEEDKRREAERIANLTPEQKAERERQAELQEKIHLAKYMFFADNYKVTKVSQVKIEVNKIYNAFDDSDEGDETFRTAKEAYIENYGEKKGIRMLKILKFMTYFSKGMENSGYVTGEYALILQKVNEIFTEMLTQK